MSAVLFMGCTGNWGCSYQNPKPDGTGTVHPPQPYLTTRKTPLPQPLSQNPLLHSQTNRPRKNHPRSPTLHPTLYRPPPLPTPRKPTTHLITPPPPETRFGDHRSINSAVTKRATELLKAKVVSPKRRYEATRTMRTERLSTQVACRVLGVSESGCYESGSWRFICLRYTPNLLLRVYGRVAKEWLVSCERPTLWECL